MPPSSGSSSSYEIRDRDGNLVAVHERYEDGDKKRFVWKKADGSVGLSVPVSSLPLYRIDKLSADCETVVVCEGEKAADALAVALAAATSIGVVGTVCGAHTAPGQDSLRDLLGRKIVLWPDNDAVGRAHMDRIANALVRQTGQVYVVGLAEGILPPGGDAVEFIEQYGEEAAIAVIERAIAAGEYRPSPFPDCIFEPAGYRTFRLSPRTLGGPVIEVSNISRVSRTTSVIVSVYAPASPDSFFDLGGLLIRRKAIVHSQSSLRDVAKEVERYLGSGDWERKIEYLIERSFVHTVSAGGIIAPDQPRPTGRVEWVFRGRVLRGRTVSFFGAGGAGKSTLADGLAISLASGVGVVPMWVPVAPMTVALLDWDEGEHEWLARTAAICRGHGVSPAGQYVYIPLAAPLVASVDYVAREISKRHISVLIVSPVSRAIRQISDDRDPAGAVHELYELLRELGTTNILIDHVAAASMREESLSKEYGSVAKRDNARGSFAIKTLSQIPGRRVVQITNTKPPPLTPKIPDQEIAIHYDPPNSLDGQYNSIRFTDHVR